MVLVERVRCLSQGRGGSGPVVYWMSRDVRVEDNWALLYACDLAKERDVVFCLVPSFLDAATRHFDFLWSGLLEVEADLARSGI